MTRCRGEARRKAACLLREYLTDVPRPYRSYPNLELLIALNLLALIMPLP
jgi:hypothetical protein